MQRKKLVLADNKYTDALQNILDYATGQKKIKLNTPKIELPPVEIDLTPETTRTLKIVAGILGGAIVIHAFTNLKRK